MKAIFQIIIMAVLMPFMSFGQNWGLNNNECSGGGPKYITTESVKIYEHMDFNSAVKRKIPSSTGVFVTNSFFGSNGWWKICHDGKSGWVRKSKLSDNPISTKRKKKSPFEKSNCDRNDPNYYAKLDLTIREHMDFNSAKVGNAPLGSKVFVTNSFFGSNGWWKICYKGTTGWVRKVRLSEDPLNTENSQGNPNTSLSQKFQSSGGERNFDPYMGITTGRVNFRKGPSTNNGIIKTIQAGNQLYAFSRQTSNGYYKVIHIETAEVGFVHKNYVKLTEKADVNYGGAFQSTGYTSNYNSDVSIENQSSYNIKLIVSGTTYTLSPYTTKSVSITPNNHYYIATAPGVVPASGFQEFKSNNGYKWVFYVTSSSNPTNNF